MSELEQAVELGLGPVDTMYFGGGTPSQLSSELVGRLVAAAPLDGDAEVTLECNPDDVDVDKMAGYRETGITRVSLGAQSMSPHVLSGLGRRQRPEAVREAVAAIGEGGFSDFNVDLVYGGAGETDEDWLRTLEEVINLEPSPPHVSAYALTVEPGTPLAADSDRHPDDDTQARRYEVADSILGAAGLDWYEISNWARPGHECRHNQRYWTLGSYRGIGAASHSHHRGRRWWNVRTPDRFIEAISAGRSPAAAEELLSAEQRGLEAVSLGLRTREGIPLSWIEEVPTELDGLTDTSSSTLALTRKGRLLASEVTGRLVPNVGVIVSELERSGR